MRGISGLAEDLLVSQEGLCSMEFIGWLVSVFVCYMFELSLAVCLTIEIIRSEVNLREGTGARVYGQSVRRRLSSSLGKYATVFQAEICAILACVCKIQFPDR